MAELIPCDLHVHPDYSIDARSTIREYCLQALRINLSTIGFTTHYDVNPERVGKDAYISIGGKWSVPDDASLEIYLNDIEKSRQEFPELNILAGLEIDYFPGIEDEAYRLTRKFELDYLIGSVHCLEGLAISESKDAKIYFGSHTPAQMADSYFGLLYECVNSGVFKVIGHADYYTRFSPQYYGEQSYDLYRGRLERIGKAASKNGTGFEINTLPIRKGGHFHPRLDFLKDLISFGAKINSIGSDSHHFSDLGSGIVEALRTLELHGYRIDLFYENPKA